VGGPRRTPAPTTSWSISAEDLVRRVHRNKIARFDPATAKFSEFPLPGLDSQVRKMAVDQAGAVWLSEYKNSRMVRVVERR